jgi:DNA invertase Pin-like site-specific DNA recombinase
LDKFRSPPTSKTFGLFHPPGALGEFEKGRLRERTLIGLAHAKACGKILGRPKVGDQEKIFQLFVSGFSVREIATKVDVSRGTVHRIISRKKLELETSATNSLKNIQNEPRSI